VQAWQGIEEVRGKGSWRGFSRYPGEARQGKAMAKARQFKGRSKARQGRAD
jgi:hypothetical protein